MSNPLDELTDDVEMMILTNDHFESWKYQSKSWYSTSQLILGEPPFYTKTRVQHFRS